jgi:hypothetical protein
MLALGHGEYHGPKTTKSEVRMRSRLMSVASHVKGLLRHILIIVQLVRYVAVRRAKT